MNRGQAVLPPKVEGLVTDEMKGFTKAWNAYCGGKRGTEAALGLTAFD
ncbi:hypothetical protein [Ralstonia insidiosa]|uniref:Uncharacterized protein n=1 Tax=Ralstonia insidiosa TaxID=190721 RepID=A0A848NZA8_9RALS|nr:hypothetical protein [Ralstonia insidiosa]NMV36798.1 hypothetical protein [Ralstonia insidiosa]